MKNVMGGYATIGCFMGGAAACASPNGVPYGGNTPCVGIYASCMATGAAACATDTCCTSWTCNSDSTTYT